MDRDRLYNLYEDLLIEYGILYSAELIQELINIYYKKNDKYPKEYE